MLSLNVQQEGSFKNMGSNQPADRHSPYYYYNWLLLHNGNANFVRLKCFLFASVNSSWYVNCGAFRGAFESVTCALQRCPLAVCYLVAEK